MTVNPLLALALALAVALVATIAAAVYAHRRTRRRIAELRRQTRREIGDALAGQPPATGDTVRLAPKDTQPKPSDTYARQKWRDN